VTRPPGGRIYVPSPPGFSLESVLRAFREKGGLDMGSTVTGAWERFPKRSSTDSRECQNCGAPLEGRTRRGLPRKYCSPRCRKLAWLRKRET
jgi:hypothetical protein